MTLTRTALVFLISLGGCGPALGWHTDPINAYRAYGEYHPASDDAAVVTRAATADPDAVKIRLFQEAFPPGIEVKGDLFGVSAGYSHHILGKYVYSNGAEQSKDALVVFVKRMCVTVGANAAIINFLLIPNDHQDRAQGIEAVLIDLHDHAAPAPSPAAASR